jgi:hypothetical protein
MLYNLLVLSEIVCHRALEYLQPRIIATAVYNEAVFQAHVSTSVL